MEEEPAEHVLALGDPRDGFDMLRMEREDDRDERAAAFRAGHAAQHEEERRRVVAMCSSRLTR